MITCLLVNNDPGLGKWIRQANRPLTRDPVRQIKNCGRYNSAISLRETVCKWITSPKEAQLSLFPGVKFLANILSWRIHCRARVRQDNLLYGSSWMAVNYRSGKKNILEWKAGITTALANADANSGIRLVFLRCPRATGSLSKGNWDSAFHPPFSFSNPLTA